MASHGFDCGDATLHFVAGVTGLLQALTCPGVLRRHCDDDLLQLGRLDAKPEPLRTTKELVDVHLQRSVDPRCCCAYFKAEFDRLRCEIALAVGAPLDLVQPLGRTVLERGDLDVCGTCIHRRCGIRKRGVGEVGKRRSLLGSTEHTVSCLTTSVFRQLHELIGPRDIGNQAHLELLILTDDRGVALSQHLADTRFRAAI